MFIKLADMDTFPTTRGEKKCKFISCLQATGENNVHGIVLQNVIHVAMFSNSKSGFHWFHRSQWSFSKTNSNLKTLYDKN